MFDKRAPVADNEEVFIISFHKIPLTGILFKDCRVGLQLFQLLFGGGDLLLVILLALLQLLQLAPLAEMAGDEIPGVEKQDPDSETHCGEQVFVLQPGWDMHQQLHNTIRQKKRIGRSPIGETPDPVRPGQESNLQLIF